MAQHLMRGGVARHVCAIVGTLSLLSATAVIVAAIGYTGTWAPYFFPFVLVAIGQILYGLLFLLQPWRAGAKAGPWPAPGWCRIVAAGGIAANAALLALLVYARGHGLIYGPLAGHARPFGPLSLIVIVTEVLLVGALALFLGRRGEPARVI